MADDRKAAQSEEAVFSLVARRFAEKQLKIEAAPSGGAAPPCARLVCGASSSSRRSRVAALLRTMEGWMLLT